MNRARTGPPAELGRPAQHRSKRQTTRQTPRQTPRRATRQTKSVLFGETPGNAHDRAARPDGVYTARCGRLNRVVAGGAGSGRGTTAVESAGTGTGRRLPAVEDHAEGGRAAPTRGATGCIASLRPVRVGLRFSAGEAVLVSARPLVGRWIASGTDQHSGSRNHAPVLGVVGALGTNRKRQRALLHRVADSADII